MKKYIELDPEVVQVDVDAIERKVHVLYLAGTHCDACNKVLEDTEYTIHGYGSGMELGLCRKCASFVNTPSAIDAAEKDGQRTHSRPVFAPSAYPPPVEEEIE